MIARVTYAEIYAASAAISLIVAAWLVRQDLRPVTPSRVSPAGLRAHPRRLPAASHIALWVEPDRDRPAHPPTALRIAVSTVA